MLRPIVRTATTALRALRRNVLRSTLTCLGIIIGIAAVIALVEIGQGSSASIRATIEKMGANVIQVDPADSVKAGVSSGAGGRANLTPDDAAAIASECGSVLRTAPSVDCHVQIVYGNRNWSPQRMLGSTPDYLSIRNWDQPQEGVIFEDEDVRRAARVCVVGQTIAKVLFDDIPAAIGKEIRVNNVPLRVVGVLSEKGANSFGWDEDDFLLAPWTTIKFRVVGQRTTRADSVASAVASAGVNARNQLYPVSNTPLYVQRTAAQNANLPMLTRFADINDIFIAAAGPDQVSQAMDELTSVLRERHRLRPSDPNDFRIRTTSEISESLAKTTGLMTNLLLAVALISLVVGGVGIMNIMLVSVTERTREIGLRMAVGARGGDILRQFIVEAVILCLAGGVVGVLFGRSISFSVRYFLGWPVRSSLAAIVASVGVAVGVGLIFGYYPAWKASRLDPIEALRYE